MRIGKIIGLVILGGLMFSGCKGGKRELVENAPPITNQWKDDTGRDIKLTHAVQKVVSLAPSVTEMIFAVGGEKKLIARSQACDFPEVQNLCLLSLPFRLWISKN